MVSDREMPVIIDEGDLFRVQVTCDRCWLGDFGNAYIVTLPNLFHEGARGWV